MKTASITEAKNNLSALTDGLKSGSPVLILDRGRPVARLEPVTTGHEGEQDGRLARSSVTALCGPAARSRPGRSSADNRQTTAARECRHIGGRCASRRAPRRTVRFWDASAIVPLLVAEPVTRRLQALAARGSRHVGVVGFGSGMRLGPRPPRARRCARRERGWHSHLTD